MTKDISDETSKSPLSDDNGDFLVPPSGYDKTIAETFAELPYEWRRYLSTREAEIDKGFGELQARITSYAWLDDVYKTMAEELRRDGVASKEDWLRRMIDVEKNLRSAPQDTLNRLAQLYGKGIFSRHDAVTAPNAAPSANVWSAKIVEKQLQDFADGKDELGQLKHPFYQDVAVDIYNLLSKGAAKSLEEAYDMAIWLNKVTRAKLIAQNIDSSLQNKNQEAQKSKAAAFTASGKAEPDYKNMSLREELEHRFAAMGLVDE